MHTLRLKIFFENIWFDVPLLRSTEFLNQTILIEMSHGQCSKLGEIRVLEPVRNFDRLGDLMRQLTAHGFTIRATTD